jgi:hypothetical protein
MPYSIVFSTSNAQSISQADTRTALEALTTVAVLQRNGEEIKFARIFDLQADPKAGHFAPVRINDTLTLLFDDDEFESRHYALHVSDAEFDAIFGRICEGKLA